MSPILHAAPDGMKKPTVDHEYAGAIGEAIARTFIREGAKVIIADIADKRGLELCQDLGSQETYLHCNVSKEEDMESTVDEAIKLHGQLDIMFNNAGVIENPNSMGCDLRLQCG